jgi:hypothetical protein
MATVLYARVSTAEQTIDHQLAHARAAGFATDEVVADNGVWRGAAPTASGNSSFGHRQQQLGARYGTARTGTEATIKSAFLRLSAERAITPGCTIDNMGRVGGGAVQRTPPASTQCAVFTGEIRSAFRLLY